MVEHTYGEQGDYKAPNPDQQTWEDEFEERVEDPKQNVLNDALELPPKDRLEALYVRQSPYVDDGSDQVSPTSEKRVCFDGGSVIDLEDEAGEDVYIKDETSDDIDQAFDIEQQLRRQELGEFVTPSRNYR